MNTATTKYGLGIKCCVSKAMTLLMAVEDSYRKIVRQRASLILTLLAASVLTLTLAGCVTQVKLIGDYDDVIDKGVSDVQQKFEFYYAKLTSTPTTPYDQSFYDDIHARLAVLKTRAASTPKSELVSQQLAELEAAFDDLQKFDRSISRPIKPDQFKNARSGIEVTVESILKLEIALKRGISPSSTQGATPSK